LHGWLGLLMAGAALAQAPQPNGGGVRPGTLPRRWLTGGPNCMEVPDWQVHEYNSDLYILRESGCTNYEKPFLYLIFGESKAMLLDTGAGKTDVAHEVDGVISKWLARNHRNSIPLIVAHSHSHSDHVAGDSQFRERPDTTVIPLTIEATQKFFGIDRWPDGMGQVDLGGRAIDVFPIPGHNKLSLAYYDRQTGILFTGDTVYPGRLYVDDFPAFVHSIARLVEFTRGKIVTHLLGCHIEQTATPYLDYPIGSMYQPDEHPLELGRGELLELDELLRGMDQSRRVAMPDFTVWPVDAKGWQELEAIEKATLEKQRQSMWGQPK
jgi:glyoxylase-like metal-dependent hydrolase (beta-lactamase superfamily II)